MPSHNRLALFLAFAVGGMFVVPTAQALPALYVKEAAGVPPTSRADRR